MLLMMLMISCRPSSLSNQKVHVRVMLSGPVQGAIVTVWPVEAAGDKLSDRISGKELMISDPTDENGEVTLELGPMDGVLLLETSGGTTSDVGYGEDSGTNQADSIVELGDFQMNSVVQINLHDVLVHERHVTISPLTTAATGMAHGRLERRLEANFIDAVDAACRLLDRHIGESVRETQAIFVADPGPHVPDGSTLTPTLAGVANGFVLASFAGLAEHIATTSEFSRDSITSLHIARALIEDASDATGLLDGMGPDGPVAISNCSPAQASDLCQVDANTWRADLAGALAIYVIPSERNGTGLGLDEMQALVDRLQGNADSDLFGDEPTVAIDFLAPRIEFLPVELDDESRDLITFAEDATPIHQATARLAIRPRQSPDDGPCPAVYKHVSRLSAPDDNPLHWMFAVKPAAAVRGQQAPAVELDEKAEYRIRRAGTEWSAEWREAELVREEDDMLVFQATLLESAFPSLSRSKGEFEIQVRGSDRLGQERTATACWNHRLLPAPLDISEPIEITEVDQQSLHALGLESNNLAPALNGEQWAGIVKFQIRNGTAKPGYITLELMPSVIEYTKSWQRANALLFSDSERYTDCVRNATCTMGAPPGFETVLVDQQEGVADFSVMEMGIVDLSVAMAPEICVGCGGGVVHVIKPMHESGLPRIYEVWVAAVNLSFLAPVLSEESDLDDPFEDFELDGYLTLPVTGVQGDRLLVCIIVMVGSNLDCSFSSLYRYHRVLTSASMNIPQIEVVMRNTVTLGGEPISGEMIYYHGFHWETTEPDIPVPAQVP